MNHIEEWESGLDDKQKQAASHIGSNALLLAGPGTGKTLTLARRVLWLTTQKGVNPKNILVLTFTRAAAAELRRTIRVILDEYRLSMPRISTLHSFALRQILRNEALTRLPQPVRIADDTEEDDIIEDLARLIGKGKRETKKLMKKLSADWQDLSADGSRWEREFPDSRFLGAWKEHRKIYGYTLRSELVYQMRQLLLERSGDVDLEGPPEHVLVDEFQDLNACDLGLIKALHNSGSIIFAAGDDDQSIYGFRFAYPLGIREFSNDYSPSKTFTLETCHRCGKNILNYGLFVAEQDLRRISKRINPSVGNVDGEVHVLRFSTGKREADGIALICQWLINHENIQPQETLVLLRNDTNRVFSRPIVKALLEKGIEALTASNPLEPLTTEYGRRFLSILRLRERLDDDLAWKTLLSLETGIGKTTLVHLYKLANESGQRFSRIVQRVKVSPELIPNKGKLIAEKITAIDELLGSIDQFDASRIDIWLEKIAGIIIKDDNERKEIIEILLRIIELNGCESLGEILRDLTTSLDDKEQDSEAGKIRIMTMHQAKGLTAAAVILAGSEDEFIPGKNTKDEERRLLYVSLTRAREYLYVTYCLKRLRAQSYYGRSPGTVDRNLTEFLSGGPCQPEDGQGFCRSIS